MSPAITPRPRWAHQQAAFEFVEKLWKSGRRGAMLAMAMGCIEGDAEIIVNRGGNAKRMSLRHLYYKSHGGQTHGEQWDPSIASRVASLSNGELHLNRIVNVIHRGVQPVVRLTLASGRQLRLTPDHKIAIPGEQWTAISKLKPGDSVLVNGTPVCAVCQTTDHLITYRQAKYRGLCQHCARKLAWEPRRRSRDTRCTTCQAKIAYRPGKHHGLCRSCAGKLARPSEGRIIDKDGYVRLYGMRSHPRANAAGQVYEHIAVMEQKLGRVITADEHVHHKNKIRHDNRPENLEVLSMSEHHRHHGKDGGYLRLNNAPNVCFIPKIDTVISVEPAGETDVYDLEMAAPAHNFVANGVIVHNCGKTRVAIDLATEFNIPIILILCPLRVVEVWREQFQRYAPGLYRFLALDDRIANVAKKTSLARQHMDWAAAGQHRLVVAINFESARSEPFAHWALTNAWPLVIADESHRVRMASGRTSRFVSKLTLLSRYRLALTGTPMAHQPIDVWAQFRFLDPTIYDPTFGAFKMRHAVMGGYFQKEIKGWKDLEDLNRKFYSIAFRVSDSVLDLPPELDQSLYTQLDTEGARIYREMEQNLIAWLGSAEFVADNALVRLLRLQQITGGTLRDETGQEHQVDTAKERLLADFLEDLDPTETVVVFAKFKSDLRAIHRAASKNSLVSGELSGEVDDLARWQRGEKDDPTILAVQIQAGGVGVDLTRARYAIYFSMGFSLTDYLQSRARVRRPPQTRPVTYYHLLVENSIDENVLRAVLARQDLIESVLEEIKCSPRSTR